MEDMSDCPGTFLLDYTAYPEEILNEIAPDSKVYVYVFDGKDICSDIITYTYKELEECDFEFKVPIKYRGCNALVWHGSDAPDYDASSMKVGESLYSFYLSLITIGTKLEHVPAPLWASNLEKVDFCASKTRHRIHMLRLHTEVNVALNVEEDDGTIVRADMNDYKITIKAANDVYHCDYSVSDQSELITYTNGEEITTYHNPTQSDSLRRGHAGTLRILADGDCTLSLTDIAKDEKITVGGISEIDLVQYMLAAKDELVQAEEEMSDQRFLDLNKVWDMELLLDRGHAAISLTINGWTVWFNNAHLD